LTEPEIAIELAGVTKRYGDRVILDEVDLAIPTGQTSVLLGPSGTGKSTLLRLVVGLEGCEEGTVRVFGDDVAEMNQRQLLAMRKRLGMLFQENALFGSLTVLDNVTFPLVHHTKQRAKERAERAEHVLDLVGLAGFSDRLPDQLSGGQRKRVALARAIVLEPEIVLFDEPTSGLDPQTSAAIDALLRESQAKLGLTFVVITHDVTSAREIAHRVGVLMDGKLAAWGTTDEVWATTDPRLRDFLDRKPPKR
jgi:phospholipid/cholesterol/gamma-HCH transport system ATP-binding protein